MDGIGSKPSSSREVSLRNNVESLNVCEIEWTRCWNFPNGMKDGADLSHKKTFDVHQPQPSWGTNVAYRPIQVVVAQVHLHRPPKKSLCHICRLANHHLVGTQKVYEGEEE